LVTVNQQTLISQQQTEIAQPVVESLKISANKTYIKAGLNDGDRLCLTSLGQVLEGRLVTVNQQTLISQQQTEIAQPVAESVADDAVDGSAVTLPALDEVAADE
jgi:hypothetical protein